MAKYLLVLLMLLLVSPLAAQASTGSSVMKAEFQSATLKRVYQYTIYLPAGYTDSARHYPVIYLLHGRGDDMSAWLNIRATLDQMIASNDIPPIIAVLPDMPSSQRASYYVDSQYTDGEAVETAFFSDLIPHIELTYRTLTDRNGRLVGGYSMGGYGAIRYSMAHPQMFSGALVLSPAVYTPLPPSDSSAREFGAFGKGDAPFDESIYRSLNYPALADSLQQTDLPLSMFIAVGDDEYHNPRLEDWLHDIDIESHLLYNRVIRIPNVSAEFRVYDGGHDWMVWQRGFTEGMKYLTQFIDAGA
jgi:enterochelin esterase-like enzyme